MPHPPGTLILTRAELEPLIAPPALIGAVERAFRARAQGETFGTAMVHGDTPGDLEFHIKAGGIAWGGRRYFALKANGSCFSNRGRRGLPNILGAILLFDGESGYPLAVLESTALTRHRTAAGTAAALRRLAASGTTSIAIFGCGNQGRMHVRYLREVFPLEEVWAYDSDPGVARDFAAEVARDHGLSVRLATSPAQAAGRAPVLVACTPAKAPYLTKAGVRPGTTIAAVGSDSPDKQELEAAILKEAKVVVDILEQCAAAGELHHALAAGLMTTADVHGEIGEVIAGLKPARENGTEVIVYDATGTALQDAAGAIVVYEKALELGSGRTMDLFAG